MSAGCRMATSPYVGLGQLDGNGIPLDFFSDVNARLEAIATCFDYETYIADALGEGVRNNGPIILNMLGYNPDGPMYEYDPGACAAYLGRPGWRAAGNGFRFQVAFNTGNTTRQTIGEILQAELAAINPKYQIETIGLPWPTILPPSARRSCPSLPPVGLRTSTTRTTGCSRTPRARTAAGVSPGRCIAQYQEICRRP